MAQGNNSLYKNILRGDLLLKIIKWHTVMREMMAVCFCKRKAVGVNGLDPTHMNLMCSKTRAGHPAEWNWTENFMSDKQLASAQINCESILDDPFA